MREFLFVAVFGALGAVARYYASFWVQVAAGEKFAFGTLAVNLVGCFLLGAMSVIVEWTTLRPELQAGVRIGFLGAFTTFSTFGYETFVYITEERNWTLAAANLAANVVLGLACVWAGVVVARLVYGPSV